MKYEDETPKPNFVLQKAVEKLNTYGMDILKMYADEVGLSFCDRNRCISKCKIVYGRTDLAEMACPDELTQDRWAYYTREMRYSPEKARRILKLIDDSYNNQFIPRVDAKKMAKDILKEIPESEDREEKVAELRSQASGMLQGVG